jgi:hypothetical protein
VGAELPLELLATVNDGDEGIEALLESATIVERSPGAAAFRTPLARDAVYAAIPWTRRRALHRRVAEALEARGESVEQTAEHWLAAGEPDRARRALLDGANRSRRLHAHRDTVQLLRRALDQWPSGQAETERLAALDQLGDAAQLAGSSPTRSAPGARSPSRPPGRAIRSPRPARSARSPTSTSSTATGRGRSLPARTR